MMMTIVAVNMLKTFGNEVITNSDGYTRLDHHTTRSG